MNISKNFVLLCSFFVLHFYFNFAATAQEWQWAKGLYRLQKYKGPSLYPIQEPPTKMVTDKNGNVYVNIMVSDTIEIGGQKINTATKTTSFIVKYNTDGSVAWKSEIVPVGTNSGINTYNIHCDSESNIYIVGVAYKGCSFGTISLQTDNSIGFVAKYNRNGICEWAKAVPNGLYFSGVDREDNIVLITETNKSFSLDSISYTIPAQNPEYTTLIAKLTKEGRALWIKKIANAVVDNNPRGYFQHINIAFDNFNNIICYLTMYGKTTVLDEIVTPTGISDDIVVVKMDKNVNKIWIKKMNNPYIEQAFVLNTDSQNNIYLTGAGESNLNTVVSPKYVFKLLPTGTIAWHKELPKFFNNYWDFKINFKGKLYLAFFYYNFDNKSTINLDNFIVPTPSQYTPILAQMNSNGQYEWATSFTTIGGSDNIQIDTDNYDNVYVSVPFFSYAKLGANELRNRPEQHRVIAKLIPCPTAISITGSRAMPCDDLLLKTSECINCTYQWFRNGQPIANATQANYTATENGDYQVVARNTTCAAINSNTLQVEIGTLIPAVILGKDKRLLCGKTDTLQVQTIQGASYQWFRNNEKIAANLGGNQAFLPISLSGEYKVTVSKPNICPNTSQIVTVKFQNLTAKIKGDSLQKTCEKAILRADVADTTAYKYKWTHNGITLSTTQATLHTSISGVYQLQLQQDSCFAISPTISLQILTKPVAKIIENTNNMLGNTLNFCETGVIHSEIAENITYQWLWNRIKVGNLANLVIKQSGNYQLVASNGVCTDTSQILKINIIPSPTAKIEQKNPTFFCTKGILTALQDENNNNPNFEKPVYSWFRNTTQNPQNPTLELVGTGTTLNVNTSGRYQLQVSRQNCSTTSETIEVILNKAEASIIQNLQNLPTANNPLLFCESGILEAVIFPNTSYEWFFDNRSISKNATTIATTSGIYQLKASQEFCVDSAIIYVEVQKFPENPTLKVSNTQFCKEHKVFLEAVAIPDAKYRWQWNGQKLPDSIANNPNNGITQVLNGSTVSSINSSGKLETNLVGNYQVFAIRKNGCEKLIGNTVLTNIASTEIKILANKQTFALNTMLIFPNPSQKNISLQTLIKPAISLEISANTAQNSTLIWQSSQWFLNGKVVPEFDNLSKITPTEEGNYQFFGIDAKGCKTTTTSTKVMFDRIKNMEISIFDALGRLVFQHHLDTVVVGATVELPIENLSMGLYLLKISTDKGEKWSKILKE